MCEYIVCAKTYLLSLLLTLSLVSNVWAQEYCYTSGGVFGIIAISVFCTLFVITLVFAIIWILWIKNRIKLDFILKAMQRQTNKMTKKDLESNNKEDYAFDNPYFDDHESGHQKRQQQDLQNGHKPTNIMMMTGKSNGGNSIDYGNDINDSQIKSCEKQKSRHLINSPFVKSLPLSAVFHNMNILNKKYKQTDNHSMDDNYVHKTTERNDVELTGRDFTGLGFNLYGNMRDGIFVKDVLSRGPANESGKVKTGDRIISVTVSFESMVFDDAVAILSYASPYNVKITLEKGDHNNLSIDKLGHTLNVSKNITVNTRQTLLHPIYRSHSVDDLTQIIKDISLSEKSTNSDGKNMIQKIKTQILNKINAKHLPITTSSITIQENPEYKLNNKMLANDNSLANVSTMDTIDNSIDDINIEIISNIDNQTNIKVIDELFNESQDNLHKPVVIPVAAKRKNKAPQPPSELTTTSTTTTTTDPTNSRFINNQPNVETIETTALVHNVESLSQTKLQDISSTDSLNELTQSTTYTIVNVINNDEDNDEDNDEKNDETNGQSCHNANVFEEVTSVPSDVVPAKGQSPQTKLKSSSMSDLTNRCHHMKSVLLERAVSLDMNGQSLPEENLSNIHTHNVFELNDENVDSMPIMNWSLNKQMTEVDINSSDSTLDDINNSLVNTTTDLSQNVITNGLDDTISFTISLDNDGTNKYELPDEVVVTSLPIVTSTPMKSNVVTIDQSDDDHPSPGIMSIQETNDDNSDKTVIIINDNKNISHIDVEADDNQSLIQLIKTNDDNKTATTTVAATDVIEVSAHELDHLMMSHKQFLQKQIHPNNSNNNNHNNNNNNSKKSAVYQIKKSDLMGLTNDSLDFESWSYLSEDENNSTTTPTTAEEEEEPTLYKTALDVNLTTCSEDMEADIVVNNTNKPPEVAAVQLKNGQNEQPVNTVIISTKVSLDPSIDSSLSLSTTK